MIVRNLTDPDVRATLYRAHGGGWATMVLDRRHLERIGFLAHGVLPPGRLLEAHADPMEEIYFIVRGRGRMQVGEESKEVGPGDAVPIPIGAPHALENIGDEEMEILVVASPW